MLEPLYIVGQVIRVRMRASDMDGQPVDPGTVALLVRSGSGDISSVPAPDIVRDGTGIYHADLVLDSPGRWAYRWELSAPNAGAAEGVITVTKSRVVA